MLRTSRERSVKIVATLGPASDSAKTSIRLLELNYHKFGKQTYKVTAFFV